MNINKIKSCSDSSGWSDEIAFKTPPAGGSDEIKFIAFGDMGKAPRDSSTEHYIQVNVMIIYLKIYLEIMIFVIFVIKCWYKSQGQ